MLSIENKQITHIEFFGKKFIRRNDLTDFTRLYIAFTAHYAIVNGIWGTVSSLAREFMISRTFVYMLASTLEEASSVIFGADSSKADIIEQESYWHYILSLRMEGKCSLENISAIMKRFNIPNSGIGSISQYLNKIGSLLPNTLKTENDQIQMVVFLSDEIFSKNVPILVTVEPVSSAILKIELADSRKSEDWKQHWEGIQENGYLPLCLVSDEGTGLIKAQKEALSDIFRQPDTYHAIAHQLGKWVDILEKKAYKAINLEYDRYDKIDSAKSDKIINKRIEEYENASQAAIKAIELYENYHYLYFEIINQLLLFDKNGNLRDRKDAEQNISDGLKLLEELNYNQIQPAIKKIRRILPELLNYFDVAKIVLESLSNLPIENEALKSLCLAWQWNKSVIKAKKAEVRHYCADNEDLCLQISLGYLQEDYEHFKEEVYKKLDNIVQSSSLVECINSIIRPYLNTTRNNVNQELLNLIMYYHNHRRYKAGKRKNKTPYEILSGKKQNKDWIEMLFEYIKEKEVSIDNKVTKTANLRGNILYSKNKYDKESEGVYCQDGAADDYPSEIFLSKANNY